MEYIKEFNKYSFDQWFKKSKITNEDGTPKVVYHQTSKEGERGIFSKGFDIKKGQARLSDNLVPEGFFFKESENDISVSKDNVQLKFYLSIQNPLYTETRQDVLYKVGKMKPKFLSKYYDHEEVDREYKKKFDEMFDSKNYGEKMDELNSLLKEWEDWVREDSTELRNMLTDILKNNGYDGMVIKEDVGSFGRKVKTIVALYPHQIKSIDNITFNPNSNKVNEGK
jgi:hypothetical protein